MQDSQTIHLSNQSLSSSVLLSGEPVRGLDAIYWNVAAVTKINVPHERQQTSRAERESLHSLPWKSCRSKGVHDTNALRPQDDTGPADPETQVETKSTYAE